SPSASRRALARLAESSSSPSSSPRYGVNAATSVSRSSSCGGGQTRSADSTRIVSALPPPAVPPGAGRVTKATPNSAASAIATSPSRANRFSTSSFIGPPGGCSGLRAGKGRSAPGSGGRSVVRCGRGSSVPPLAVRGPAAATGAPAAAALPGRARVGRVLFGTGRGLRPGVRPGRVLRRGVGGLRSVRGRPLVPGGPLPSGVRGAAARPPGPDAGPDLVGLLVLLGAGARRGQHQGGGDEQALQQQPGVAPGRPAGELQGAALRRQLEQGHPGVRLGGAQRFAVQGGAPPGRVGLGEH